MINKIHNYSGNLINYIYRCKQCGKSLLMSGCENPECDNYYIRQSKIKWDKNKSKK